jgi:16S rRNA (guanine966-N2)-methyltransferase
VNKAPLKKPKPGAVRIVAGTWRRRTIEVPPGEAVRPTSDRVREALFNSLIHGFGESDFRLHGARVVDVFAGTGALGLEALSRGAAFATFVEGDPATAALIRRNIAKLGAYDRATVLVADGAYLPRATSACDLALVDPPYGKIFGTQALSGLASQGWLKPGALVSLETESVESVSETSGMTLLDRRAYGRAAISIFQHAL